LLWTDCGNLVETVNFSDFSCSAHLFPLDFTESFPHSVRDTLGNVFGSITDLENPVGGDQVGARGARGMIIVRGESLQTRLRVVPGF
jgi:hypothetical protein